MNKVVSILFLFLIFTSCELTDQRKDSDVDSSIINVPATRDGELEVDMPIIEFENLTFNFGSISQGEKASHSFRFKNNGKANLVISKVEGSCGCTILKGWPSHPIEPG